MAASKWQIYNEAKKYLLTGDIDLNAVTLVMKVVASAGAATVSDYTRSTFASAGTALVWKASSTRHALDSVTITANPSAKSIRVDAADEVFTASAAVSGARFLVIGVSGGKALCWSKLSAATTIGAGSTMTVAFSASGIFELTGGVTA